MSETSIQDQATVAPGPNGHRAASRGAALSGAATLPPGTTRQADGPGAPSEAAVDMIVNYLENHDQSFGYAKRAMERMAREHLDPIPETYAVWYTYFSGRDPEVNSRIDAIKSLKGEVTSEECARIYLECLAGGGESSAMEAAGQQVQDALSQVLRLLESAGVETNRYADALADMSGQIADESGQFQLRAIIDELTQETSRMIDQNKQLNQELTNTSERMQDLQKDLADVREEALTDTLTGIANRKKLELTLHQAAQDTRRSGRPLVLAMIDIDHFKQFNDTHGHQTGDLVLKLVAQTLTRGIDDKALAARYGGEEFAVVFTGTGLRAAQEICQKLRKHMGAKKLVNRQTNANLGHVTMSVGVSQLRVGEDLSDLIARADQALYKAKAAGRDKVVSEA